MSESYSLEQLAAEVRRLVDRQEIADVLYRYASCVDYKDHATLRSLFVDDAHGIYTTPTSTGRTRS